METWEVYNAKGEKTGRIQEEGRPPREGEFRLCGSLWLLNAKGELLIQQRAQCKSRAPGKWSVTGGGALAGETGLQACLRETKEELGLAFEPEQLSLLLKSVGEGLIFEDYIVRCDLPKQAMTLQAQEVSQVRWASPQEIRALFDGGEFIYQESELQKVLDYARESLRESGLPGGEKAKLPD